MAYGPTCWSNVELQNLAAANVTVAVEGHKGSGALVALVGSSSISQVIAPAQKVTLKLQVPGEESLEGWVKVTEATAAQTPAVTVSGETECVENDSLTTLPQTVAFPTRNPWLTAYVNELDGRVAMILNASNQTATANACYSRGSTVSRPAENGTSSAPQLVCIESLALQIPPFGTRMVPVVRDGNTQFSIETRGESLVLRVLLPQRKGIKAFAVDSTVKFGEPLIGPPR
jgi:hypothetical protein